MSKKKMISRLESGSPAIHGNMLFTIQAKWEIRVSHKKSKKTRKTSTMNFFQALQILKVQDLLTDCWPNYSQCWFGTDLIHVFFLEAHHLPPGYFGHTAHLPGPSQCPYIKSLFHNNSYESVYGQARLHTTYISSN